MSILVMQNRAGATKMKLSHYQIFAQLCESIVEASTTLDLIKGSPGGDPVVKSLHKDLGLAHNLEYKQIDKITWNDLKNAYRGAWVILIGAQGTGAIKATSGAYETLASDGGDVERMSNSRSDATMNFLKGKIGRIQKYYVAKNTAYVSDKQKSRAAATAEPGAGTINQETLVKKFKPLWTRAIATAIADIKGHVSNMIKNDAFDKARNKIAHIENLQNGLDAIESGSNEVPNFISTSVNTAVLMAASHHYPEQTGNITRGYSRGYTSERSEGPKMLLQDISKGDTAKLGTVLSYFKRTLISG